MGPVSSLVFDGRVPPGVEQENMIRGSKIQAGTTSPQGHQHDRWPSLILEMVYDTGTVAGCAIQACEGYAGSAQMGFDTVQECRPLRKDQSLMPVGDGLFQALQQQGDLGRSGRGVPRQQAWMAAGLAQTQQGFEGGKHTATGIEEGHYAGQCGRSHRVIDDAFTIAEHAVQDNIGTWR